MKKDVIFELYKKPQTVFSFKELSILFPDLTYQSLKNKIQYALRANKLKNPRKGFYAKDNFNPYELANKIYSPSYISLESILQSEGLIFQADRTITAISYLTREIEIDGQKIFYRKIKNEILLNKEGIIEKDYFFSAIKERAFLDSVFLYKNYHFDNLEPLDWNKVSNLKKIYKSKILENRVNEYYQIYKNEHV